LIQLLHGNNKVLAIHAPAVALYHVVVARELMPSKYQPKILMRLAINSKTKSEAITNGCYLVLLTFSMRRRAQKLQPNIILE